MSHQPFVTVVQRYFLFCGKISRRGGGGAPPNLPGDMGGGKFWADNGSSNNDEDTTEEMVIDEDSNPSPEDIMSSKLYESLKQEATLKDNRGSTKKRPGPENKNVATKASKTATCASPKDSGKPSGQVTTVNPTASTPTRVLKYIKSDPGPYKVMISLKSTQSQGESMKPPPVVEISRFLVKCGVRFSLVENISRYKWIASFNNKNDANNTLDNKFIAESKYSVTIPWYMLFRKVIIRGVPTDVSEEELWTELRASNPGLIFDKEDIYRMKRKSLVNGEAQYINSTSVKMSLRSPSIPGHVVAWKTRLEVSPFIPLIRQCFGCGQLNHLTKHCTNSPKCLTCGQEKHNDQNTCSNAPRCINCGGNHRSLAKECPEIIIKKRITETMALENIDYNAAKRFILKGSLVTHSTFGAKPPSAIPPPRNSGSFPSLPSGPDSVGKHPLAPVRILSGSSPGNSFASVTASSPPRSIINKITEALAKLPEKTIESLLELVKLIDESNISLESIIKTLTKAASLPTSPAPATK